MKTLVAFVPMLLCGAVLSADYPIKLHRAAKAGDAFHMFAAGLTKEHTVVKTGAEVANDSATEFTVEFEAEAKVLSITDIGEPLKMEFKIVKCAMTEGGKEVELIAADKKLSYDRSGGENPLTLDEGELTPATLKALAVVLPDKDAKKAGKDDAIFGSKENQAVGAAWAMNSELAIKQLASIGIKVGEKDIAGATHVVEAGKTPDGKEFLRIDAELQAKNFSLPLPEGFTVTSSEMRMLMSGHFPTDLSERRRAESTSMGLKLSAKQGETSMDITQEISAKRAYVPADAKDEK